MQGKPEDRETRNPEKNKRTWKTETKKLKQCYQKGKAGTLYGEKRANFLWHSFRRPVRVWPQLEVMRPDKKRGEGKGKN